MSRREELNEEIDREEKITNIIMVLFFLGAIVCGTYGVYWILTI